MKAARVVLDANVLVAAFTSGRGASREVLRRLPRNEALAQADAENRYRLRRARGKPAVGLQLLDKLDRKAR